LKNPKEDIGKAKAIGAKDYLRKPAGADGFYPVVQTIASRWLPEPGKNY
jgi:hypothetical protein